MSFSPPQQATMYMQLEFFLHQTANTFLMAQSNQARISNEAMNKASHNWSAKGRYNVRQFMYDQGTQQEIIANNQNDFRFHGQHAVNDIRISGILYSWKQVAKQMTVRTFCEADSVILKLIWDIKQILEVLGAADFIMLWVENLEIKVKTSKNAEEQVVSPGHPSQDMAVVMGINPENIVQSETEFRTNSHNSRHNNSYDEAKLVDERYREWSG